MQAQAPTPPYLGLWTQLEDFRHDDVRYSIERMDPIHYLTASYVEHRLDGMTRLLIERDVITSAELDARTTFFEQHEDSPATAALSRPPAAPGPARHGSPPSTRREATSPPRFAPGDRIVTRVTSPRGHTRLPRYARGKPGVIAAHRGTHVFPDTHAHGQGEHPQPLYSVRFTAQALWGPDAEPHQHVYLDLWESYLERKT